MAEVAEQRPVVPEDLFKLDFLQDAALSPDGAQIIYSLQTYDSDTDRDYSHLWLIEIGSERTRQMTFGKHKDSAPCWSPDGTQIAFISTRGEKPQLYVLPADGGEAHAVTMLAQGVGGGPAWSPNSAWLAFTAPPPPGETPDTANPYRVTRQIFRFDNVGLLDAAAQDVYVVPAGGGDPQRLTADPAMNALPQWSPNGKAILYMATLDVGMDPLGASLRIVDLTGSVREVISYDWGHASGSAAWLPDGSQIVFVGIPRGNSIGAKNDLFVVPVDGSRLPENRSSAYPIGLGGRLQLDMPVAMMRSPARLFVAPDGCSAYVDSQCGGAVHILRVALTGPETITTIVDGERSCRLLALSANGESLIYGTSDFNTPLDIAINAVSGGQERQLTALNESLLAVWEHPVVKPMHFTGSDGVQVEGWAILPPTGSPPYPTILTIHGGPHSAFGSVFHFDAQMLAGAGFAVLMINHRASTGYGDDFSTAIKGDWGNLDYGDLMAGVDHAIDQGWCDPERMGVWGLSGGGNLSCWIVGQTERFKAAVPENPVTNWLSFYGVSDIGFWFAVEELGGHPHEIPEIYARCSPITYAHRCKTPTLLIQGEADHRCPPEQAEQFYTVLKANGCPVEMLRLPQSPHAGSILGSPAVRRAHNDALLDWMKRHVLGDG